MGRNTLPKLIGLTVNYPRFGHARDCFAKASIVPDRNVRSWLSNAAPSKRPREAEPLLIWALHTEKIRTIWQSHLDADTEPQIELSTALIPIAIVFDRRRLIPIAWAALSIPFRASDRSRAWSGEWRRSSEQLWPRSRVRTAGSARLRRKRAHSRPMRVRSISV